MSGTKGKTLNLTSFGLGGDWWQFQVVRRGASELLATFFVAISISRKAKSWAVVLFGLLFSF